MTSMKDALRRLQVIDAACNPKSAASEDAQSTDEFTRIKKEISVAVKAARKMIAEREEHRKLEKSGKKPVGSGTETAEMSFRIRTALRNIRDLCTQLDAVVKKAERKIRGKNKRDMEEILASRREIVKLCFLHLEECENLDKARFNEQLAGERVNLFTSENASGAPKRGGPLSGGLASAAAASHANPNAVATGGGHGDIGSELPDIEVQEDLALIQQRAGDLDRELDEIAAGVTVIKQIAIQMGEEVDKQNEMLDEVDQKIERTQETADNVNTKMRAALDGVMGADKFLIYCVLFCILLGLVSYILSLVV